MPSSPERTTRRGKRAGAALGVILTIACGLAYTAARGSGSPPSAQVLGLATVIATPNFTISGSPPMDYLPGVSQPVDLTVSNPFGFDLSVTGITTNVGPASRPDCGVGNLIVTQDFSGMLVVPAHVTRSLSGLNVPESQWPILTMPDTASNQDACTHATFQLTYTGTGSVTS